MEENSRHKRVNKNKESRLDLLRRIRESRESGEKLIIDKSEEPVYDIVSEKEYAKIVHNRMQDDWLVDDCDYYADDGREIFDDHDCDDDMDYDEFGELTDQSNKKLKKPSKSKKSLNPDLRASSDTPMRKSKTTNKDIRSMFSASSSSSAKFHKPNFNSTDLDNDLDKLIAEIDKPSSSTKTKHRSQEKIKLKSNHTEKIEKSTKKASGLLLEHDLKPTIKQSSTNPFKAKKVSQITNTSMDSTIFKSPQPKIDFKAEEPADESVVDDIPTNIIIDNVEESKVKNESLNQQVPIKEVLEFPVFESTWMDSETGFLPTETYKFDFDTSEIGKNAILFYYFDAYEDIRSQPGTIYLFGKVPSDNPGVFKSACMRIKDLERRVYLLPRKNFSVKEVYSEFRELSGKEKITKFRCKPKSLRYAFEIGDVPNEAEYLEIRYASKNPALSHDFSGNSFSHVFVYSLENFLLDLHLKGPCWLRVSGSGKYMQRVPLTPQISWCHIDYDFTNESPTSQITRLDEYLKLRQNKESKPIQIPQDPPFTLISLDVKTVLQGNSNCEIIAVGMLIDFEYRVNKVAGQKMSQAHYLVLAPPKDSAFPFDLRQKIPQWGPNYVSPSNSQGTESSAVSSGVDLEINERALLGRLLVKIQRLDPDIIVGHDLWGHTLEWLLERLTTLNIPHWHRLGRLRRFGKFHRAGSGKNWFMRHALPGRLFCDSLLMARELVHARKYNLSDLCKQVLPPTNSPSGPRFVPKSIWNLLSEDLGVNSQQNSNAIATIATDLDARLEFVNLKQLFNGSSSIKDLIDFTLSDAHLVLRLVSELQALPLAFQITGICGNVLSRTLCGGRSERNEFLLLHAFTESGYLVPDPPQFASNKKGKSGKGHDNFEDIDEDVVDDEDERRPGTTGRKKPAYHGGLVLEPRKGFYDKYILLLDFNSLYPSIIQEFNICFTTVDRNLLTKKDSGEESNAYDQLISALASLDSSSSVASSVIANTLPTNKSPGILPNELRKLVESRREVKKLIASAGPNGNPAQLSQWNIRQQALKITANSVYGCLGFSASRFFAKPLAAIVTGLGRALLMDSRDKVENMNLEVIYGDTDSIMINTNTRDLAMALQLGDKIRSEINKRYKLLEIDTDGVYASMLLLAKKKYAALSIINPTKSGGKSYEELSKKEEIKGLDVVRRDWSPLASNAGKHIISMLLAGQERENVIANIHQFLQDLTTSINQGKIKLEEFTITKMLTKKPEDYHDSKGQPHVHVALRHNSTIKVGGKKLRQGDTIDYVICEDGSSLPATQRAYSPQEYLQRSQNVKFESDGVSNNLTLDIKYYLTQQLHPVISRLVAPIEGTSPARIASCLGLNSENYSDRNTNEDDERNENNAAVNLRGDIWSLHNFNECTPLFMKCTRPSCGTREPYPIICPPFTLNGQNNWKCPGCNHNILRSEEDMIHVVNLLILQARRYEQRYTQAWMQCEDQMCQFRENGVATAPFSSRSVTGDVAARFACRNCGLDDVVLLDIFNEAKLFKQLSFFKHLVDSSQVPVNSDPAELLSPMTLTYLKKANEYLIRILSRSNYAVVDLGEVFSGLRTRLKQPNVTRVY